MPFRPLSFPWLPSGLAAISLLAAPPLPAATFSLDQFPAPGRSIAAPDIPRAGEGLTAGQAIRLRQAGDALSDSKFERAETLTRALLAESPEQPDVWYLLGLTLANLDRMEDAIAALDQADRFYDDNAGPLVTKGDILASLGRGNEARDTYLAAVAKDPLNWLALENLGVSAEKAGHAADAISWYEKTVEHAPMDRLYPRLRLAELLIGQNRAGDAATVMAAYVASRPDDAVGLTALGFAQLRAEMFAEAAETYRSAVTAAPDEPNLVLRLAEAQRRDGALAGAVDTLEKGRAAFAGNAAILVELGRLKGAMNEYEQARAIFQEGLEAHPDDRRLLKGLSLVQQRLGETDAALALAERLSSRDDAAAADHVWQATLLERAGQPGAAMASYERALQAEPENWVAANNLSALLVSDDPARALTLAESAAEYAGQVPAVMDTLAWAQLATGQTDKALALYDEIAAAAPQNAVFAYRHGRTLLSAGRTAEGRAEVARALELDPGFAYAEEARALLSSE
ncbi:Flp pilus assembly protein TadD, contains TPR repeats [Lutimaribacter pacificus]|uniref:Flp pilus assembly protein TadD, contains TPR repeats n=1 Tax=Lutimaribacter pacificus TaxID=391948 RepID=A0A1H0AZL5_9RHOB|nr:tetratricopeptide repeat protein [Lutimaribacter pacificus]SDN38771.1 Flp pilus assembly protein TadD, contains TPR repeats [Lutimaribacter pacificus]SHJ62501.1 Flp pilus assembly protein TadD, contains TPR repeats [Lutimaribacter pacificus]